MELTIKKKKLSERQIHRLKMATLIDGHISQFVVKSGVSDASIRKARHGKELSEQIIDKIIKAL